MQNLFTLLSVKRTFSVIWILFFITSCVKNSTTHDNSILISEKYCSCVNGKLLNANDSSVNVNECNYILFESRFIQIHFDNDKTKYSEATIDSAAKCFIQTSNITDTMCWNKIDRKKLLKLKQP
jgi:hypothetical protein